MSGALEKKLDKVFKPFENLTERINKLDLKLVACDNRSINWRVYLMTKSLNWNRLSKTKLMLVI